MRGSFVAFLLLAGCTQTASEKARSDVEFLKSHGGSKGEICDAYEKLVAADLAEHNDRDWALDRVERDTACNAVALERLR